ncbi:MAG: TetR/AcrR family transcriptional regulator [Myxococcota bacterium]
MAKDTSPPAQPGFDEPTSPPTDPAERLVAAAIAEIEAHGLSQVTVRGIAKTAGMNVAAVNYHFGSKDALLSAGLDAAIAHMLEDTELLLARVHDDPHSALPDLLAYYLEGSLRYPRISKAHLHGAFSQDDYSGTFPTRFGPVLVRLRDELARAVPGLARDQAARRVVAAISAILFPAFFAGLFTPLRPLDTPAERLAYAAEIAAIALMPPR